MKEILPSRPSLFDEFSPRVFLLQVRQLLRYLLKKWWIIVLSALLLGTIGCLLALRKKKMYEARLSFALDEGVDQKGKNRLDELRSQLGLSPSLEAGGVFSSVMNMLELMRSRMLIEKTLRGPVELNGKKILFADFFLDSLEYREEWLKKSPYYRIDFKKPKPDPADQRFENGLIRRMYETILKKYLAISPKGSGTTIIEASCTSEHELFSQYFLEAWINEVIKYYVESKTQRSRLNFDFIEKRTDSVRRAYFTALYGRASFADAHLNPNMLRPMVPAEKQQTDVQILQSTYISLSGSLENAKTNLLRETPLIQYLDMPLLPLKTTGPNLVRQFILFALLGVVASAAILSFLKIYRFLMK